MSDQVAIEVIEGASVTVEVVEDGGVQVVEITAPSAVEVVEVIHPGPQGPPGSSATFLSQLLDVDATDCTNGSILYFSAERAKFVADSIETKINLTDGGNF